MQQQAPLPKFLVDQTGKKSAVVLSVRDYERLLSAWEEVADANDFSTARKSARSFVSLEQLQRAVCRKK